MPAACYAEATEARAENQVPPRVGQYPGRRDLSVLELFASSSIWGEGTSDPGFGILVAGLNAISALSSIRAYPLWGSLEGARIARGAPSATRPSRKKATQHQPLR